MSSPTVAIVKYNAGNVHSVQHALQRIGISSVLTDDFELLRRADKVIFPGVGEAQSAMSYLEAHGLRELIIDLKQPVLGICIGMQLLCRHSEEGDVDCLGIFDVNVKRFQSPDRSLRIPEVGWNSLHDIRCPELLRGVSEGEYVYYVHSYYAPVCQNTVATTDYILPYSAALQRDNFFAVQFHPEKSGSVGERILHNFVTL